MMERIKIYTMGIMASMIITLFWLYSGEKEERQRVEANQTALLTDIQRYKTSDSLNAISVQELILTKREMKEHEAELVKRVKELGIKLKRLESTTSVSTQSTYNFTPVRKDSIIYIPGKDSIIHLKCLEYKDSWTDFIGCYDDNDIPRVSMITHDSIDIIGHIVPKNIWFIKYGVKSVNSEVINYNPYSEIKYAKVIKLKK